jgi:malate synthase
VAKKKKPGGRSTRKADGRSERLSKRSAKRKRTAKGVTSRKRTVRKIKVRAVKGAAKKQKAKAGRPAKGKRTATPSAPMKTGRAKAAAGSGKPARPLSRVKRAARRVAGRKAPAARKHAPRATVTVSSSRRKAFARGAVPRRVKGGTAARPAVTGVAITAPLRPRYSDILTPAALSFLADLHRRFDGRRRALLAARAERQKEFDAGALPDFLAETTPIRGGDWRIAPIPADLLDRRVEITGPVDRKMIINALNSGANVFMADFEDANSPSWDNNLEGQINLKDRWQGKIDFTDPETGKHYALSKKPAVLIVRPRGWHLMEAHLAVDGEPIAGAFFDFGLYAFHNAKALGAHGTAPYFYLPKLESHQEARLWNDVFVHTQNVLGLPKGTIKATVLIETLPAAFEMDEILWELRDHITGLNAGRWDYIFSFIKKLAKNPNYILPDRDQVVMGKAFLGAYAALLVKTCHRRGAFAMGGMAAQIPVKGDEKANAEAFAKVRADKEREVRDGHDGTWVAHPALVPVAKEVFDRLMPQPNQLDRLREDVHVTRDMLLEIHPGTKTEEGFRKNIRVGVQYIEAWLRGRGAVPIYNLMEDAATAEISRAQIWQWLKYGATLENGIKVTPPFFLRALDEEMQRVKGEIGAAAYDRGRFPEAIKLFRDLSLSEEFVEFLTIPAYKLIM